MKETLPIVRFRYDGGTLVEAEILASRKDLPIEYKCSVSDLRATELFMDDRVVPASRQGLQEELERIGLKYYGPELLLRHNKGVSIEDNYWVDLLPSE